MELNLNAYTLGIQPNFSYSLDSLNSKSIPTSEHSVDNRPYVSMHVYRAMCVYIHI